MDRNAKCVFSVTCCIVPHTHVRYFAPHFYIQPSPAASNKCLGENSLCTTPKTDYFQGLNLPIVLLVLTVLSLIE